MTQNIFSQELQDTVVEILNLLQSHVNAYGHKKLFPLLRKQRSTGFNELNISLFIDRFEWTADPSIETLEQKAKLGFFDFILYMIVFNDTQPLVRLCEFFNMASHKIPSKDIDPQKASDSISKITQVAGEEFTQATNEVIKALAGDGVVDKTEAERVHRESMEAINALYDIVACADIIRRGK